MNRGFREMANGYWSDLKDWDNELKGLLHSEFGINKYSGFEALTDLIEQKNGFLILMEIPGVKREDIEITLQNTILLIRGMRKRNGLNEKIPWIKREIASGEFEKKFKLSEIVDTNAISAEYKNGILKIFIPKKEEEIKNEKTIEIKIN